MAEYIEREAAYTLAKKINDYIHSDEFHTATFGQLILDFVDDLPAADVKPVVRGEWIKKDDGVCWWWECSVCGERPLPGYKTDVLSDFCPNCGADMRGEDNGEIH